MHPPEDIASVRTNPPLPAGMHPQSRPEPKAATYAGDRGTSQSLGGLRFPRAVILVGCFALLFILGWVDYMTGYELGFFVFYSLPVGLAAWYAGRWPAVVVAFAASMTWWLADLYDGVNYSTRFYFSWNLMIHFLAFVINAVTISKIKRDVDERGQLMEELVEARALQRRTAEAPCPSCGRRLSDERSLSR